MIQEALKETTFDEVFDSQKNFRVLMDAMSRPGEVFRLYRYDFTKSPAGMNQSLLTILKTLGDNNVTFSSGNLDTPQLDGYLQVNTGMIPVDINEADFVIFHGRKFSQSFYSVNTGSVEFPENNATVIIAVEGILCGIHNDALMGNNGLYMTGPGIKDKNTVTIQGLDTKYLKSIIEINSVFPTGIDVIFADGEGNITCMPRTTKAEVE